jgi:predicted small secreted protein
MRIFMTAKLFVSLALTICILALGACNTMHGLGKDIRIGGEQLEKASGASE